MKKFFILFLALGMLGMVSQAFGVDIDKMMSALEKAKKSVTGIFSSVDSEISAAAQKLSSLDLKSPEAREILKSLVGNKDYVIDCAIVDSSGRMIVIEPQEYRSHEGADISDQPHVKKILATKKPVLSDVFLSVEGIQAIDVEYPILSSAGELLGSVSMLVKQEALTGDIILPIVKDVPSKIWIMQKDGLIIYDQDPQQIDKNIFTDEFFRPFKQLIDFSQTVAASRDGGGSYDFYAKGLEDITVVKKYSVWDTVSLYGTEWRVIVMEADQPAEQK